jgi:AcrR family transcriptional regulator
MPGVPSLTRDQILWAAVRIADDDGIDAVTLRRISSSLGVHVTSLYNHVPTRDAITDGVAEVLLTEAKLPTRPLFWEDWVRLFFDGIGRVAMDHPGAFRVLQQRPVQGARAAASFEFAIAAFVEAGLSLADAYAALKIVTILAVDLGLERSGHARGDLAETRLDELPAEGFPLVRSLAATADPENVWRFALETVIAGLRAQLPPR